MCLRCNHRNGLACDTFAAARETELFGRRALDANLLYVEAEHAGNVCLHLFLVRVHLRAFAHHDAIDIDDFVTSLLDLLAHLAEEFQAIGARL